MIKPKLNFFLLASCILLLACKPAIDASIATPKIKAGTSTIEGKIISLKESGYNNDYIEIFVPHPISGEISRYKAKIDQSGRFAADFDVETDISLVGLHTSLKPYNSILIKVKSDSVTTTDITYDQDLNIKDVQTVPEMNKYEMMNSLKIINQMVGVYDLAPEPRQILYDKRPEAYIDFINTRISEKMKILDSNSLISDGFRDILAKDFKMWRYGVGAFNYEQSMQFNFRQVTNDTLSKPDIQKIDRSYFTFLKEFGLNNPEYLICSSFADFQTKILENKTLMLPEIGDTDIPSWLVSAKAVLSEAVGFSDGPYYDILAANAYAKQLNQLSRPLSEKQKKNIKDYWKDGEIAKILFRKNQYVVNKT